jgi:hypothetical protein
MGIISSSSWKIHNHEIVGVIFTTCGSADISPRQIFHQLVRKKVGWVER